MRVFLFITILSLAFSSCSKDSIDSKVDDSVSTLLMTQELSSDLLMADLDNRLDDALTRMKSVNASNFAATKALEQSCVSIDVNNNNQLIIDFGAGCQTGEITRKGKIIVEASNNFSTIIGTIYTLTFDNYFVNNYKIEGAYTKTVNKVESDRIARAHITEDVKIQVPVLGSLSRKSDIERNYNIEDNSFSFYGTVDFTGVSAKKMHKKVLENTPLLYKPLSHEIVSGKMDITFDGSEAWSVDFGTGESDGGEITVKNSKRTWKLNYKQ